MPLGLIGSRNRACVGKRTNRNCASKLPTRRSALASMLHSAQA